MLTFESDDLLIRSQMLISKFRKQREVALHQQITHLNKPITTKQNDLNIDYGAFNQTLSDCDPYPQREKDNILLKKFMGQHYFTPSISNSLSKTKISTHCSNKRNAELSSSSESSIWSANSPRERDLDKVDCGMMTDYASGLPLGEDDLMTPITALPLTHRSPFPIDNTIETIIHSLPPKRFSSICTQFQMNDPRIKMHCSINRERERHNLEVETSRSIVDHYANITSEDDQMKAAWEYFQEEKVLERQITQQTEIVDRLNRDMDELADKIQNESYKLIEIKNEKEQLRNRRYGIFNGLSREVHANALGRSKISETQSQPNHQNTFSNNSDNDQNLERYSDKDQGSSLDSDIVRNIVNRIVCKEFDSSEDRLFDSAIKNPMRMFHNCETKLPKDLDMKEECVLSDVLSVKDLKINQSLVNCSGSSGMTMTSSMSCFNNSTKDRLPKPPKSKRKLRPAHSADNINQMVHNSNGNRSKNVRSPSISMNSKRFLYTSSSSDESIL